MTAPIPPPIPVVHIITKLELGGAQQNTLYTVAHLDRTRFRPFLMTGCGGLLDAEAERLKDISTSWVPPLAREIRPWRDIAALRAIARRLREIRDETGPHMIVHTHSSKAGVLGRWAARLAGATVIIHTFHGFGFNAEQPAWLRQLLVWVEQMTAGITDCAVVVSVANQEEGARLGLFHTAAPSAGQERPGSLLIRSGIDGAASAGHGDPALRRSLGIDPDAPVVATVACLKPQKSPLDLVAVAARVVARLPSVRFLLIGDGELRPQVEAAIRQAGLDKQCLLLGWRHDVPDLLATSDLFVLMSRWEGLPRAILEAMVNGLPVVATAVDGVTDVVRDGETGFVVPVGDVDAAAGHVVNLLERPEHRRRMGDAARQLPHEFDIDVMVRQQEALYDDLLRRKGVSIGERSSD